MAKSDAQRRREADARKREAGLTMCKVWIRPEFKDKLKQFETEHGNMEKMYMNTKTGSVDSYEGWHYESDDGNSVNAVDLGEVVEVKKNDDGDWVEV